MYDSEQKEKNREVNTKLRLFSSTEDRVSGLGNCKTGKAIYLFLNLETRETKNALPLPKGMNEKKLKRGGSPKRFSFSF